MMCIHKFSLTGLLLLILGILATSVLGVAEEGVTVGVELNQKAPDFTLPWLDGEEEKLNLYEQVSKYDAVFLCFFIVSN